MMYHEFEQQLKHGKFSLHDTYWIADFRFMGED